MQACFKREIKYRKVFKKECRKGLKKDISNAGTI